MRADLAQALYLEAKAELLRRSYVDFRAWAWPLVTGEPFVENELSRRRAVALQRVGDGACTRLLIATAPGTGKSVELVCYAGWRRARDPGHRAIHASHAFDGVAKRDSMRVRRLVEHDQFRALFPAFALRADANRQGEWETTANGLYSAVGLDSGMTGKRAREAVIDDPLDANNRFSKAANEHVWDWYSNSLLQRLDGDDAPIIVCHQRLGRSDLIGKLIAMGGFELVELPAELEDGELLAPNVLSRRKLDDLRASMGAAAFATQYLQKPGDDANGYATRTWWRFHRGTHVKAETPRPAGCDTDVPAVDTPRSFSSLVIAVDMTFGTVGKKSDYNAIQVWGANGAGRFLLRRWRKRASQLETQRMMKQFRAEFPTATIVVEKAAGGQGAVEMLVAEGFTAVIGVSTENKSKRQRLAMVSPTIEAGNCYLPLGAPDLSDFVEELAGATDHDDEMDAAGYALARLAIDTAAGDQVIDGGYNDTSQHAYSGCAADSSSYSGSCSSFEANHYAVDPFRVSR